MSVISNGNETTGRGDKNKSLLLDGSSIDGGGGNEEGDENDTPDTELQTLQETIYDLISGIRDPEKSESLEDLNVVSEAGVRVRRLKSGQLLARIEFVPTVPHCSLASIIGLTMRSKLEKCLPEKLKIDIYIKDGTHDTAEEINKQINDKERISAAMENPNLQRLVNECVEADET